MMRGFLFGLALTLLPSTSIAYPGMAYEVCGLDPNGDNFLALRAGPGSGYGMIMQLGPRSIVEGRANQSGGWLMVVVEYANGYRYLRDLPSGYVYTDYLCPVG